MREVIPNLNGNCRIAGDAVEKAKVTYLRRDDSNLSIYWNSDVHPFMAGTAKLFLECQHVFNCCSRIQAEAVENWLKIHRSLKDGQKLPVIKKSGFQSLT